MGLADRAGERAKTYSGGMQRRLSVAMALVSDPQVLFLDEPTIGLDPQSRRSMWDHLAGLKGRTTVVLTTHYLEEADALADRVGVVDGGRLVALGTPAELKDGIGAAPVTVVEATGLTHAAFSALEARYPTVRSVDGGVEIEADDVTVYELDDCLRPLGVEIRSTYRKPVTLDDVFLELTGRQLRE
jgi:ABC-2 type transport system ATP-binding protein